MADNVINWDMGGDVSQVIQNLMKINAGLKQNNDELKKMQGHSKEAERDGVSMGDKITASLSTMITRWMGIAAAIGAARNAYNAYQQDQLRSANITEKVTTLAAGVAGQYNMSTAQVMDYLKKSKPEAYGVTMEEQARAMVGAAAGAPSATPDIKLELASAAMASKKAGEKPEEFGKGLGALYEITGGKKPIDDLADMLIKFRDLTGGTAGPEDARRITSIGASKGLSPETSLGLYTAVRRKGFGDRAATEIIENMDASGGIRQGKLSESGRTAYAAIGPTAADEYAGQYKQAQTSDVFEQAKRKGMTGGYAGVLASQETQRMGETERMGQGLVYLAYQRAREAEQFDPVGGRSSANIVRRASIAIGEGRVSPVMRKIASLMENVADEVEPTAKQKSDWMVE